MLPVEYPKVVAIGGGTGLSTLLRGLKHFPVDITAIVTVADDGGSSGVLREDFRIPPPGDIRNVLVALSGSETLFNDLLQFRFSSERGENYLDGHPVGNLLLAAMTALTDGDFVQAIENIGDVLNIKGRVYPASPTANVLHAELEDGTFVKGESTLATKGSPIKRVFYQGDTEAVPEAIEAILEADVVILGPGSLYTSVIPNILFPEIAAAVNNNLVADVVYIANIMTEAGETDNYTAADHLQAIINHGVTSVNKIIVNDEAIPQKFLLSYAEENAIPVENDIERLEEMGVQVILSRVVDLSDNTVRHDSIKTAASVYAIALDRL